MIKTLLRPQISHILPPNITSDRYAMLKELITQLPCSIVIPKSLCNGGKAKFINVVSMASKKPAREVVINISHNCPSLDHRSVELKSILGLLDIRAERFLYHTNEYFKIIRVKNSCAIKSISFSKSK